VILLQGILFALRRADRQYPHGIKKSDPDKLFSYAVLSFGCKVSVQLFWLELLTVKRRMESILSTSEKKRASTVGRLRLESMVGLVFYAIAFQFD